MGGVREAKRDGVEAVVSGGGREMRDLGWFVGIVCGCLVHYSGRVCLWTAPVDSLGASAEETRDLAAQLVRRGAVRTGGCPEDLWAELTRAASAAWARGLLMRYTQLHGVCEAGFRWPTIDEQVAHVVRRRGRVLGGRRS